MTLTRATLGTIAKRATKDIEVCGHAVRIQKPTPLEFSQYQASLVDKEGKWVSPTLLKNMIRAGRLGRKTGAGWYEYKK